MEKNLIPAPIDNKNVTTDWIEEVFDFQTCLYNKNKAVGFIDNEPVLATWQNNILLWNFHLETKIENSKHLTVLKKRLAEYHDPDGNLFEEFVVVGNTLMQKFYWKNED